jgi:blue copper oxidase
MKTKNINRRGFLFQAGLSSAALPLITILNSCSASTVNTTFQKTPVDVELSITAAFDQVQIFPGKKTDVWRYHGEVLNGSSSHIQHLPDSYLGPIIRLKQGQKVRIHFYNELSEPSIIHWHGLHVPESADGHPRFAIAPGEKYIYEFTVLDRAGTYWFHPHPHGRTGPQVYNGLAGLFIVSDDEESTIGLPSGKYDLPLVIQDRTFDENNQLMYGSTNMMGQMIGFLGNQVLVNGQPNYFINAERRSYRLRLLNGSNARINKLAWNDGRSLTVIGTDGGLLEKPIQRSYITLAPAQRIELWVDLSKQEINSQLKLINLPADTPGGDVQFNVFTITMNEKTESTSPLTEHLTFHSLNKESNAVNLTDERTFDLAMGMGMVWNINGRTFEMEKVANDETVQLGDLEVWKFNNVGGRGMGMSLPHPMHIHGLQFQILDRQINPALKPTWSSVSDGFVDEGWHDTVLVMPGESVRILLKFEEFPGLFLYHCHNLEHEDMGMMRNYLIEDSS